VPDSALPAVDLWEHVDTLARTLASNGPRRDDTALRLLDATAAAGEAARAYLGATGAGPEGAITSTHSDVAIALCDAAIAALLALRAVSVDATATLDRYLRSRQYYLNSLNKAVNQSWARESA
jgi:hypothetical protein